MANDKYYLTTDKHPSKPGVILAVITIGSPQRGDKYIKALNIGEFKNKEEAYNWFEQQLITKPWDTSNDN